MVFRELTGPHGTDWGCADQRVRGAGRVEARPLRVRQPRV